MGLGSPLPGDEDREQMDVPLEGMQALLAEEEEGYSAISRGDVVEGTVVRIDREGILVDVGTKSEGIIPANELDRQPPEARDLQVGDEVLVYVVQPEDHEGRIVLSLERARREKGWRQLQRIFETGEIIEGEVVDSNKGGLIVNVSGVRGFVPASQVAGLRPGAEGDQETRLAEVRGRKLRLKIIELNRRRNRFILSERQALQEWRAQQKERLLAELQPGQVRPGRVSSVANFGAFVDLGGADGLIHLSELAWDRVQHPGAVLKVGDEIDVYVISVDPESKRIALSLRRTQPEPWAKAGEHYQVGQIVPATITKLTAFGAFARIGEGVEGLIHISELADRRIGHPKEVVKEGDVVPVKVIRFDPVKRRIGLSLRQAQEDLERGLGIVPPAIAERTGTPGEGTPSTQRPAR